MAGKLMTFSRSLARCGHLQQQVIAPSSAVPVQRRQCKCWIFTVHSKRIFYRPLTDILSERILILSSYFCFRSLHRDVLHRRSMTRDQLSTRTFPNTPLSESLLSHFSKFLRYSESGNLVLWQWIHIRSLLGIENYSYWLCLINLTSTT